jgi:DNA polymerase/3'-5' exonuclease PolX
MVEFMLAKEYTKGMSAPKSDPSCEPPIGWFSSEKYDGYRARYMGEEPEQVFLSRQQKLFNAPEWFKEAMPNINLDGELWVGRDNFQDMGVVRQKQPGEEGWKTIKYVVYDLPDVQKPFCKRLEMLQKIVEQNEERWNEHRETLGAPFNSFPCPLVYTNQTKITTMDQLEHIYHGIISKGGEGIMLKHPSSIYEDKRSNYMLKYKPSFDEEAIIIDYKEGKGKYKGMLGGFICKQLINKDTYHIIDKDENHEFAISGMDDEVRENYKESHPIGTIISYEHSGKTKVGKPRFARYIRSRDDITIKETEDIPPSTTVRDTIVKIFAELSEYERINGESYKSTAYKKILPSIKKVKDDTALTDEYLLSIRGLGTKLLEKIHNIQTSGTCPMYEKIKDIKDPREDFMKIHGVGAKKAKDLVEQGFQSIQDLRDCETITNVLNDKQQIGLKYYDELQKRIPFEEIKTHEKVLKQQLKHVDPEADITIAGSYRRRKETSGDIDVLLKSTNPKVFDGLIDRLCKLGYLVEYLAHGRKKYNGICKLGRKGISRRIDIMYTKPDEYPFAVFYFTGSDDFNKKIRKEIVDRGMSINEYSLKDANTKEKVDYKFVSEKDIFDYLNMEYVEPWDRG